MTTSRPAPTLPEQRTIRTIPTNAAQREEMLALFQELLGSVSAESLGIPTQASGRKWYPIKNPVARPEDTETVTGLYLVTEERPAGGTNGATETVVGLGSMHTFTVGGMLIEPYIYFPFLRMPPPAQGSTFVLGDPAFPIELGIDVTSTGGRFGTDEVSFDGVKVAATIAFTDDPLRLDLVLLNLKLPGQPAADRNVNDVLATPANEWIATAAYLLISRLVTAVPEPDATAIRDAVNALLELMGLVGKIPPIDWNAIVKDPARTADILAGWLRTIAADPVLLGTWLTDGYAFVHGIKPADAPPLPGTGTRADPWRVELLTVDGNRLDLTVGTVTDKSTGALLLYAGVALTSKTEHLVASVEAVGVRMQASVEVMELTIPPAGAPIPAPRIFPSFQATAVVLNPTAAFQTAAVDPVEFFTGNFNQVVSKDLQALAPNDIYLRGKNLYNGARSGNMYAYYAPSNLLLYPSIWKNNVLKTNNLVDHVPVSASATGVPYVTPEPLVWTPAILPAYQHYCMISRVSTDTHPNPIPNAIDFNDFARWVAGNGGIGWRNVTVVDVGAPDILYETNYDQGALGGLMDVLVTATDAPGSLRRRTR